MLLKFIFALSVLFVGAFDVSKIYQRPLPIQHFDTNKILGRWYVTYLVNPCSWRGADRFTDWYYIYSPGHGPNVIRGCDNWRSQGECARNKVTLNFTDGSIYSVKDSIGDALTGTGIIVAADYKSFFIAWGCTRESPDKGFCLDPWISTKNREPFPSKKTMFIMDRILQALWGVTTRDLIKIPQGESCDMDLHRH